MRTSPCRVARALVVVGTWACLQAVGAAEIQLPAETVRLKPSALPGFAVAGRSCVACHSADYIAYQPPGMSQAQWTGEVEKMHTTYGAPLDQEEIGLVGAYLAATYGEVGLAPVIKPEQPSGSMVAAADPNAATAQTLLSKNGCLGCHAIAQKVVGPSYHDVAAKYKSDPAAKAKVQASIRQGGQGRWGNTAMPPFPQLTQAELATLADFVLAQ